ncbi:MAG: hypothetical protein ACNS62_09505 [Candidatus Cyclobacteriaceae bacterium M3_2C_046]
MTKPIGKPVQATNFLAEICRIRQNWYSNLNLFYKAPELNAFFKANMKENAYYLNHFIANQGLLKKCFGQKKSLKNQLKKLQRPQVCPFEPIDFQLDQCEDLEDISITIIEVITDLGIPEQLEESIHHFLLHLINSYTKIVSLKVQHYPEVYALNEPE